MKTPRGLTAGIAVAALLALSSCGSSGTGGTPSSTSSTATTGNGSGGSDAAKGKRVTYVAPNLNPVWLAAGKSFAAESKKLGMVPSQTGPQKTDVATLVNDVQSALNSGAQGIATCALQPSAFQQVLTKAKSNKVPVALINCDTKDPGLRVGFVGTIADTFGSDTAKHLIKVAGNKKWNVIGDQTSLSQPLQAAQWSAFESTLKTQGALGKVVARIADNADTAKSESLLAAALRANPDANLIFCLNAECPGAAVTAVKSTGLQGKVTIVGIDNQAPTVSGIQSGDILFSAGQGYEKMGTVAAMNLYLAFNNKPVPSITDAGVVFLDKSNVAQYGTGAL